VQAGAIKVAKKVFAFISYDRESFVLRVTTKLGESNEPALGLPFTTPTAYGLGKSGWVSSTFARTAGSTGPTTRRATTRSRSWR